MLTSSCVFSIYDMKTNLQLQIIRRELIQIVYKTVYTLKITFYFIGESFSIVKNQLCLFTVICLLIVFFISEIRRI